jgi:AbrB family transcriptional regulator (stage V sporulation protein T)
VSSLKGSGITRKIDELGRIVVPKEMRYNLGIRDGEPLEINLQDDAIIIRKYSQVENIKSISENIINIFYDVCNIDIIITDREKIVATTKTLKHLINSNLGDKQKYLIDNRESYISKNKELMFDINNYFILLPIVTTSDSCGLIIISSHEYNENNIKYAKIIQKLLVHKLDIATI